MSGEFVIYGPLTKVVKIGILISFNDLDIFVTKKCTRIICVKLKVAIRQCCLHSCCLHMIKIV